MKTLFLIVSMLASFSLMADTQIVPKGLSGSMIDMDLPNNVEDVVPRGTAGIIYRATCFGRNNRGTDNPIDPNGLVTTNIKFGSSTAKVSHRGNFAQTSAMSAGHLPSVTMMKSVYSMACNDMCDEVMNDGDSSNNFCQRDCSSFQDCYDKSVSFDFPTIVKDPNFEEFVDNDSESFLSGKDNAFKQKWKLDVKQRLSDLYDHILRENGSQRTRCNDNAEVYSAKFDNLAQELCEDQASASRGSCREAALCTFTCGIGASGNALSADYTKQEYNNGAWEYTLLNDNSDLLKVLGIVKASDYSKNTGGLGNQYSCDGNYSYNASGSKTCNEDVRDDAIGLVSGSTFISQCVSVCKHKFAAKGPAAESYASNYYRDGNANFWPGQVARSDCKIDGSTGNVKFCEDGLMVGTTNKLPSNVNAGGISVSFTQSETGRPNYVQYYGYNGTMKSNKVSVSVRQPAEDAESEALPAVLVDAQFPGQDGYCGGFHSPLMFFFDYKHPSYQNKSNFLKKFDEGISTYWPEANHRGYFLAQIDPKQKDRGIYSQAQLFGDNTEQYNGFDYLGEHDVNKDGKIDNKDGIWSRLVLWKDKNGDGESSDDEIIKLSDKGIFEISLDVDQSYHYQVSNRAKHVGKSSFKYRKGGEVAFGEVTDVFFAEAQ